MTKYECDAFLSENFLRKLVQSPTLYNRIEYEFGIWSLLTYNHKYSGDVLFIYRDAGHSQHPADFEIACKRIYSMEVINMGGEGLLKIRFVDIDNNHLVMRFYSRHEDVEKLELNINTIMDTKIKLNEIEESLHNLSESLKAQREALTKRGDPKWM